MTRLGAVLFAIVASLASSCRRATPASEAGVLDGARSEARDATRALDSAPEPQLVMPALPPFDASMPHPDVPPVDAGPPLPRTLRAVLEAIEGGRVPLARIVDPERGVTVIHYLEATPGPGGRERIDHGQLCGRALAPHGPLEDDLDAMVRQSRGFDEGLLCSQNECAVPGMEWGVNYRVRFERRPNGEPLLVSIALTSEATMGDEWLARLRRYVRTNLDPSVIVRCDRANH